MKKKYGICLPHLEPIKKQLALKANRRLRRNALDWMKSKGMEISESQFKSRLVKAGWKPHEADEEWERIQKDEESGM